MEFCQWLMNEKGIEAGDLSDYINNNEEEVLKLAEEFKKPKFKLGGKVEAAAEMFKCGGKTKKKKVKKCRDGEELVNDKLQNIRDRNKFAKKSAFSKGNTSYDMTIGPDLNLFNDFNGKVDTLIRKSYGFKSPRSYSNEDLGHRFEVVFPGVAKFFGYKSGYQKALDDINSMQEGGRVYDREHGRKNKRDAEIYNDTPMTEFSPRGAQNQGAKIAKAKAVSGFENADFIDPSDFDRSIYRQRKRDARDFDMTRRQRKAYALLDNSANNPEINHGQTSIYDQNKIDRINRVVIPTLRFDNKIIDNNYKIDLPDFNWGDIPFEITPENSVKLVIPRRKAGWDQFANEIIAKHANNNLYRGTSSNLGMQKHYENEYDKYVKDPDNYVYSPIDAKYAAELENQIRAGKSRLKYSTPLKGRDYYDPNEHYVNFDYREQAVPGKTNWGKASDNIAHAMTGTIATTAALPVVAEGAVSASKDAAGGVKKVVDAFVDEYKAQQAYLNQGGAHGSSMRQMTYHRPSINGRTIPEGYVVPQQYVGADQYFVPAERMMGFLGLKKGGKIK